MSSTCIQGCQCTVGEPSQHFKTQTYMYLCLQEGQEGGSMQKSRDGGSTGHRLGAPKTEMATTHTTYWSLLQHLHRWCSYRGQTKPEEGEEYYRWLACRSTPNGSHVLQMACLPQYTEWIPTNGAWKVRHGKAIEKEEHKSRCQGIVAQQNGSYNTFQERAATTQSAYRPPLRWTT